MTCFKVLGWRFPVHLFDQHTAYLAASNVLLPSDPDEVRQRPRKRLSDACRAYGIEGWERLDKEEIAKAIGDGRWREYGRDAVLEYCDEDVRMEALAAARAAARRCDQRGHTCCRPPTSRVFCTGQTTAQSASPGFKRAACRSTRLWNLVQENKPAVIGELLRQFDPSHGNDEPIYTPEGEWSYNAVRAVARDPAFRLATARQRSARHWRRRLPLMYHVPGIEGLHALRDSIGIIAKAQTSDRP